MVGDFEGVFKVEDGVEAVVEVGKGFPGGLFEGVAYPANEVIGEAVEATAL